MNVNRDLHERNRWSWNAATEAHNSHKGDQTSLFQEPGGQLSPEERSLLGDIDGLRIVHLQCNSGQDTLSLATLGARVTGVDISDTAIGFARNLSVSSGISAEFFRADVYDWVEETYEAGRRFDVAFASFGAVIWLSDLVEWAAGIERILAPDGRFVLVEFHPIPMMFDDNWVLRFPYSPFDVPSHHLQWDDGVDDYIAVSMRQAHPDADIPGTQNFSNPHPCFEFVWGIGDVLSALIGSGLVIEQFKEYPYSRSGHIPGMRQSPNGTWVGPDHVPLLPYMYSVVARKR